MGSGNVASARDGARVAASLARGLTRVLRPEQLEGMEFMRRTWTAMSVFLWACAGGQTPAPNSAAEANAGQSQAQPASAEGLTTKTAQREPVASNNSNAKSVPSS